MRDLAVLTAHEDVEFAMQTKGQTWRIIRGDERHVNTISAETAKQYAEAGWSLADTLTLLAG